MIFKTLTGSSKRVSKAKKYLIQWNSSSRSKMQFNVKQYLKKYWSNDIVFEEFPIAGTKMTFDFYNPNKKVAIEHNGIIIPKSNYKKKYLKNNDKLEVVHFIGGGQFEGRYF